MSDRAQQVLLWLLTVVLVGGTIIALNFASGYRPLAGLPGPSSALPPEVALRFNKVRVVGRSANERSWTMSADHIDTSRSHTRVDFSGKISAALLKEGKTPRATVTAGRATYDILRQKLSVSEGITCRVPGDTAGKSAVVINGPDLEWEVGSQIVRSNGPVKATLDNGDTIQGEQMIVDLKTKNKSFKNVSATFYVQEDETATGLSSLLQKLNP